MRPSPVVLGAHMAICVHLHSRTHSVKVHALICINCMNLKEKVSPIDSTSFARHHDMTSRVHDPKSK